MQEKNDQPSFLPHSLTRRVRVEIGVDYAAEIRPLSPVYAHRVELAGGVQSRRVHPRCSQALRPFQGQVQTLDRLVVQVVVHVVVECGIYLLHRRHLGEVTEEAAAAVQVVGVRGDGLWRRQQLQREDCQGRPLQQVLHVGLECSSSTERFRCGWYEELRMRMRMYSFMSSDVG